MDGLADIFAWVCGRGRCFEVGGQALPLCQRCLGLYVGSALTAAWLLATGLWRRGLPPWSVFVVQALALLAAMLGGLHVLEAGAGWRVACGLWTGHVAVSWLAGASRQMLALSGQGRIEYLDWTRRQCALGILAVPLLGLAGLGFDRPLPLGRTFWTCAAATGMVVAAGAVLAAGAAILVWTVRRVRPARKPGPAGWQA